MFVRVRDCGLTYKERFPDGSEGHTAFAAMATTVAEVDAFSKQKQTGRRDSKREKQAPSVGSGVRVDWPGVASAIDGLA